MRNTSGVRRFSVVAALAAGAATLAVWPAQAVTKSVRGGIATGLKGAVVRGPTVPAGLAERPCSAPASDVTVSFVRAGKAHRTTTDAKGHYRIALRPGRYTVRMNGARFGFSPRATLVVRGQVAVQDFHLDTGIR
jgi:hypothetical protein